MSKSIQNGENSFTLLKYGVIILVIDKVVYGNNLGLGFKIVWVLNLIDPFQPGCLLSFLYNFCNSELSLVIYLIVLP